MSQSTQELAAGSRPTVIPAVPLLTTAPQAPEDSVMPDDDSSAASSNDSNGEDVSISRGSGGRYGTHTYSTAAGVAEATLPHSLNLSRVPSGAPLGASPHQHVITIASSAKPTSRGNDGAQHQHAHHGLRIMFKDLTYTVPSNTQKGQSVALLKGISAFFEPNQMAALMGPSGSGKTTLLDLLAGRKTVGKTQGTLLFGHRKPTPAFLRRYTGYVEQFDTLLGDLSVREMLLYTAELKRPRHEPLESKKAAVDKLLQKLALESCRDVKIGDPLTKGISGGQAKRVNIGIALITNPRVLFLDEPTSGLDSFTANGVMRVVKSLVSDGTTICATIHSPTAATFALFDRVLLLVRGHVAYFGPQGPAAMAFASSAWSDILASSTQLPQAAASGSSGSAALATTVVGNEAEWLTEVITDADQRGEAETLAEAYRSSYLRRENEALLDHYIASTTARHAAVSAAAAASAQNGGSCKLCKAFSRSSGVLSKKLTTGSSAAGDLGNSEYNGHTHSVSKAAGASSSIGDADAADVDVESPPAAAAAAARPSSSGSEGAVSSSSGDIVIEEAAGGVLGVMSALEAQVDKELATRSGTVTPWWWAIFVLLKYRTLYNYRNPAWLGARLGDKLLISLIILTVYLGIGDEINQGSLVNIQSALFMWALLPAFGAASYVPALVLERRLFYRERSDGLYTEATYLFSKLAEEIFLSLVITVPVAAYVYFGVQFKGTLAIFWLVYFIDLCVGIVLAYLIAALSPNMDVANAALPGFVTILLFFAGQLMTFDAMPVYWKWFSYIDFLKYAWGALMINQFEDNDIEFTGGQTILQYYDLKHADKWAYIGYLSIFFFVFTALALLVLKHVRHQKR